VVEVKGLISNSFVPDLLKLWALKAFINVENTTNTCCDTSNTLISSQSTYLTLLNPNNYIELNKESKGIREEYKVDMSLIREKMGSTLELRKIRGEEILKLL
jgi:hypothetical protein